MSLSEKEIEILNKIKKHKTYEDAFFSKISDPKWFYELKNMNYFKPNLNICPQENEDGYFFIPHWNVLDYLEKVSIQTKEKENEKYIDELINIIKDVTKYHIENNKILDNYRTWWYFIKILCNLPNDKIADEIINYIPVWLDTKFRNYLPAKEILENLLPKFLKYSDKNDLRKAEIIIDFLTEIKWIPKYNEQQKNDLKGKYNNIIEKQENERKKKKELEEEDPELIIDPYLLNQLLLKNGIARKIGEKCSLELVFKFANKLKEILIRLKYVLKLDFSYSWLPDLYDNPILNRPQEILALVLKEILVGKAKNEKENTKKILRELLSEKYGFPIFRRIVLFIIAIDWDNLNELFWEMIKEEVDFDLLNSEYYKPELYRLFQKCVSKFSLEEKEKIKCFIEERIPGKLVIEEKYKEAYILNRKQFWYSALKTDEYFNPLYKKYRRMTKREEEISFKGFEIKAGFGKTPLTKDEILKKDNSELANYLKDFRTKDFWEGPTVESLAEVLKDYAENMPEKFINDLNPFLNAGYLYVYNILWGIKDAFEKKKSFDWGNLFNFIKKYIDADDFWKDKYIIKDDTWYANHLWIVGIIGEIIVAGTKDDARAFSEEYFEEAENILSFLVKKLLSEKEFIIENYPKITEFLTYSLDSPIGKISEALVMLALRIRRIENNHKKKLYPNWEDNIKKLYENLLNEEIIESYVWLGNFLANFYYIDKEWTKSKIAKISIEKGRLWEAFFSGYLFSNRVYNEIYLLMEYHYSNAIKYEFIEKEISRQLVRHISVQYLRGVEKIEDEKSLFKKLLTNWNVSQILEIISFFWLQRGVIEESRENIEKEIKDEEILMIKNNIINFWRWIYENKYKDKQKNEINDDDKKILCELCTLTTFLDEINKESFEWLKLCAPFADISYRSSFFIDYLNKIKDKSVNFVGKIYLEMLKGTTPDYKKEDIISIVKFLYEEGKNEEADDICNTYGIRGNYFLRDLYNKYNNK